MEVYVLAKETYNDAFSQGELTIIGVYGFESIAEKVMAHERQKTFDELNDAQIIEQGENFITLSDWTQTEYVKLSILTSNLRIGA